MEPNPGTARGETAAHGHRGERPTLPSTSAGRGREPRRAARRGPDRPPALDPPQAVGERPRGGRDQEQRRRRAAARRLRAPCRRRRRARPGGSSASSGLPARNASACAEKMAAHVPVSAASSRGGSGAVGATWTRACSPTSPAASITARSVSRVGSPNQVVCGKTMNPIDDQHAATRSPRWPAAGSGAPARTASSRRGERRDHQLVGRRRGRRTRDRTRTPRSRRQQAGRDDAIRRCARADVPWVRAIVPSASWTGAGRSQSQPARVSVRTRLGGAALQLGPPVGRQGRGVDGVDRGRRASDRTRRRCGSAT